MTDADIDRIQAKADQLVKEARELRLRWEAWSRYPDLELEAEDDDQR